MKKSYIVVLIVIFLSSCKNNRRIDWTIDNESQYKTPYGTYVLRNELVTLTYHANEVQDIKKSTLEFIKEKNSDRISGSSFIHINNRGLIDSVLWKELDEFTENFNQVFIADNYFSKKPQILIDDSVINEELKKINLQTTELPFGNLIVSTFNPKNKLLKTELFFGDTFTKTYYIKTQNESHGYFIQIPENAEVIGTVLVGDSSYPNFVRIGYQNGYLLHADPLLFTNYYMLKDSDYHYVSGCLSYLVQAKPVFWDGYRTISRYSDNFSNGGIMDLLKFIIQNKGLKWGFLILFIGILFHLITNSQRILGIQPTHKQEENYSIKFIDMITAVFNREKNYNKLAQYKMNYFFDKLKNDFNISSNLPEEILIEKLHEKTKFELSLINELIKYITLIKQEKLISQSQFINFSQSLNSFIIKTKKHE